MPPSEISPFLLDKYLQNQCTDSEKELVEAWYASITTPQNYLDKLTEAERRLLKQGTFERIQMKITSQESVPAKKIPWGWISGIAATIILAVGLYFQQSPSTPPEAASLEIHDAAGNNALQNFTNHEPRIVMHTLPDGSTVWMHKEASISYPQQFDSDKRTVAFTGEGFFDIKKDKNRPFSIASGEMVIKVLGTSFNVQASAAKKVFQISVVTGSVEVTAPNDKLEDQLVVLKPQQQAFFEPASKRLRVSLIPISEKREIYQPITVTFRDTPLNQVIAQLQKKFNTEIVLANPEMATCLVNADFEQQSLPLIMEMLCTSLEARYTMTEKTIHLDGMPCD